MNVRSLSDISLFYTYCADLIVLLSDKIKKIVGWKAKTSLEEGLKNTIDYFRDRFEV